MRGHAITLTLLLSLVLVARGYESREKVEIVDEFNCRNTRYGCCPDGKKAALGPDFLGCYTCADDPCKGENMLCRNNSKYIMGYICYCPEGYELDEGNCKKIERVACNALQPIDCSPEKNRECIETTEGTSCYCLPGYEYGDEECLEGHGLCENVSCQSGSTCYNSAYNSSAFKCVCDAGYEEEKLLDGEIICVLKNCRETPYGCCPNSVAAAEGENSLGCSASRHDTRKIAKDLGSGDRKKTNKYLKRLVKSDVKLEKKFGPVQQQIKGCCSKENFYNCGLMKGNLDCRYRYVSGQGWALCCPSSPVTVGRGCDCHKCIVPVPESSSIPWYKEPCFRIGRCRPSFYVSQIIKHFCIRINPQPMLWFMTSFPVSWPTDCQCKALFPVLVVAKAQTCDKTSELVAEGN